MSPRGKKASKKPPAPATIGDTGVNAKLAKATAAPKVDVRCTFEERQIRVSMECGAGCSFRARAHQVGGPGYVCSGWVSEAGTAILPVEQATTYRVAVQLTGSGGRGPWAFVAEITVPRLAAMKPPRG